MDAWPSLVDGYVVWEGFEEFLIKDPTIRTETADGRPLARTGTQPLLKGWRYTMRYASRADRDRYETFQETTVRVGGEVFRWQDPRPGGECHVVRLAAPLRFTADRRWDTFRAQVELHEEPGY